MPVRQGLKKQSYFSILRQYATLYIAFIASCQRLLMTRALHLASLKLLAPPPRMSATEATSY